MAGRSVRWIIIALWCVCILPLSGADQSVIVRSPYYGEPGTTVAAESLERSFAAQLGLELITDEARMADQQGRVLSAISNTLYPVTPGDMLSLVYTEGKNTITLQLQVDGSYRVVIPAFGTVDGRGKTLVAFAREIEQLVVNYMPFSLPRVNLIGTGSFTVTLRGEVRSTRDVPAWGLTRLSSVVSGATDRASTRQVRVVSADGSAVTYDLFTALREGDLAQNPFVRAGDVVTILPATKIVTLAGEIGRPGVYQPLTGERLSTIVERYGNGILPSGDAAAVLVRRYGSSASQAIDVIRVSSDELASFEIRDMDTIYVSPLVPLSRAVTVEGAVHMGQDVPAASSLSSSGRLYYQFFPGETVLQMMQAIAHRFWSVSDLASAYLLRSGTLVPVDIQSILLGKDSEVASLKLQEGDRFVIPFNQLFVNVTGGVLRPGTFPYIPDKGASYYINLAGGFDPAKNRNGAYAIVDKSGNKLDEEAPVPPEAVVTAKLNTFQAVNGLNLATTVTIVGLVSTILGIVLTAAQISRL